MRPVPLVAAGLLAASAGRVGWGIEGALLGLGGLLSLGYSYGRFPRAPQAPRPGDPEWEEARARGVAGDADVAGSTRRGWRVVDPEAKTAFFQGFRARSRTVDRALRDTSQRARPFLEPWPTMDPRHPRLAEAMDALRRGDDER